MPAMAWGTSGLHCQVAWPPALALHHSMAMQLPVMDKTHTTAVSWFAVRPEMVNEKSDRSGCKELPPFI